MRNGTKLILALVISAFFCHAAKTRADDYSQTFDAWIQMTAIPSTSGMAYAYTNDDNWILYGGMTRTNQGGIWPLGTYPPAAPTNNDVCKALWMDDYASVSGRTNLLGQVLNAYLLSPFLSNGVGTITMASGCRPSTSTTNSFVIKISTNGMASWTNLFTVNATNSITTNANWVTNNYLINVYTGAYVMIEKTGDSGGGGNYLGIEEIGIVLPPSYVTITNAAISPAIPLTGSNVSVSATITPFAEAVNLDISVRYSTNMGASYSSINMSSTGANYYVTDTPLPAITVPGSRVYYYIQVNFDARYSLHPTTNWPASGFSNNFYYVRQHPFASNSTFMAVSGSLHTNMLLTGDNQWRIFTPTNNLPTPSFFFTNAATVWGDNIPSGNTLPVNGSADNGGPVIPVSETVTNRLCFSFNDTNLNYDIQRCAYADFTGWGLSATNFGNYTNSEGWIFTNARINQAWETDRTLRDNFALLSYNQGTQQCIRSPYLSNGVGTVSFWYRNYQTNAWPAAGFTLQKSTNGTSWVTVDQVTGILSLDYLFYSNSIGAKDFYYVRLLNNTNGTGSNSTFCVDEFAVSEPGACVILSNPQPPGGGIQTNAQPVNVSIDFTPYGGASNVACRVYYRYSPTSTNFDSSPMTSNGPNSFAGTIPPTQAGKVDYYFRCTYDGFMAGPAAYPKDAPISFLSYTNLSNPTSTRIQTFDAWAQMAAIPSVSGMAYVYTNSDSWFMYGGMTRTNQGGVWPLGTYPPAAPTNNAVCKALWMDDYASVSGRTNILGEVLNAYLLSPIFSNGIGTVTLSYGCRNSLPNTNTFVIKTSSDLINWTTNFTIIATNSITTNANWATNSYSIGTYSNIYLMIEKLSDNGPANIHLGIDEISVSPPPADVVITNICYSPGYPSAFQDITLKATFLSVNPISPAFGYAPKLCYSNSFPGSVWLTNSMTQVAQDSNTYSTVISGLPAGQFIYFIRCDFDGYYFTNGVISEKASPAFSPDAPPTTNMPSQCYTCMVRRFQSEYDYLAVTGSIGSVTMALTTNNVWMGVFSYDQLTNSYSFSFSGFGKDVGYTYSSSTNTWGDDLQPGGSLPMGGNSQLGGSNITLAIDQSYTGKVIFTFNTVDNTYMIKRGVYQDFNEWMSDPDYFEENYDTVGIITYTNSFNSWSTNSIRTSEINHELEDFQSCYTNKYIQEANVELWYQYDRGATMPGLSSSNGWFGSYGVVQAEYEPTGTASSTNKSYIFFRDESFGGVDGAVYPGGWVTMHGLKDFSFDYRVSGPDACYAIYPANFDSTVTAYISCTNLDFLYPSISIFSKYISPSQYYEFRVLRRPGPNSLMMLIIKKDTTESSLVWSLPLTGFPGKLSDNLLCTFSVVTNNAGSVYLEASCTPSSTGVKYTIYTNDTVSPFFSGNIGFHAYDTVISVDSVGVKHSNIQRFNVWTNILFGTYTNAGWVVKNGYVTNTIPPKCVLNVFGGSGSSNNFESWTTAAWGGSTNNSWIINDGLVNIATNGSPSGTNVAFLRNDTPYTNSYLLTPDIASTIEYLSFSAKDFSTNSLQFAVQTSNSVSGWQTFCTITNPGTGIFSYTNKMKITFTNYNKGETLIDFPALVVLSTNITNFTYASFTSTNGYDLRFSDLSKELPYEIESWNTAGTSYVWVKVPALSGTNSSIWAFWGGTNTTRASYTTNGLTWSQGYCGVWHLTTPDGLYAPDSGMGQYHGDIDFATSTGGKIGNALDFNQNAFISIPAGALSTINNQITISMWLYGDTTQPRNQSTFEGSLSGTRILNTHAPWSDSQIYWDAGNPYNRIQKSATTTQIKGQWNHWTFTKNCGANNMKIYYNGSEWQSGGGANLMAGIDTFKIGSAANGTSGYDGMIDEFRISSVNRSSNWIWAVWLNTASNSMFCNYAPVTSGPLQTITNWTTYIIGPFTNSPRLARIFANQTLSSGVMLGLDDVAAIPLAPSIASPFLGYGPGQISFATYGNSTSKARLRGSPDNIQWTTIADQISAVSGTWTTNTTSGNLSSYRYFRIESIDPSVQLQLKDIYIDESTNTYYNDFSSTTNGWLADSHWFRTADGKYARNGYVGTGVTFKVETNWQAGIWTDTAPATGWATESNWTVTNFYYNHFSRDLYAFQDYYFVRVTQTGKGEHKTGEGAASLVVDNLTMSSWRGTNFSTLSGTNFVTTNDWYATEAWAANRSGDTNNHIVELWRRKADPAGQQYIRSPLMMSGIGALEFEYKVANPPTMFEVQISYDPSWYSYITTNFITATNTGWQLYTLRLNTNMAAAARYARVLYSDPNMSYSSPVVLSIDNMKVSDFKERDQQMWYAYNGLITPNQHSLEFEPAATSEVKTCFLNNNPDNSTTNPGVRTGIAYTNFMPFVQTPFMSRGIGEVGFWYRRWDSTGTNPAKIYIRSSDSLDKPESQWSTLTTLTDITNTEYAYFFTNFFNSSNYFLMISCDTNPPASRLCIDNVLVTEPVFAKFDVASILLTPEQPQTNQTVKATVVFNNFILSPTNIVANLHWCVGTNPWAPNWTTTNSIPFDIVLTNLPYRRVLTSSSSIPAQNVDTVVQYYVYCTYGGRFVNEANASPKYGRTFTNPPWYFPVNLNSNQATTNPYYYVYSSPTGSVWINEINYGVFSSETNFEYIELAGAAGTDILNWQIHPIVANDLSEKIQTNAGKCIITNGTAGTPIPDDSNGYGFFVWGDGDVPNVNSIFTNPLSASIFNLSAHGGLRLVRSMGAYEQRLYYGSIANTLSNLGYKYVGKRLGTVDSSIYLAGTGTIYSAFSWHTNELMETDYTPGAVNSNQVFQANGVPESVVITISNFWVDTSNLYLSLYASTTNVIGPRPFYSTNLLSSNWYPVTSFTTISNQASGVYTQWFSMMTGTNYYFYKVVATNSP